jgi:NADH-quinone oxidoreductase subunit J
VTALEIGFVIVAAIGSIAALRLVTSRNVVHAALYLTLTLAMVATAYLMLAAEFVGWVQVLIYVGAIVVLLLFALMLTKAPIGREALDNQQRGVALLVALGSLGGLVYLLNGTFGGQEAAKVQTVRTAEIGESLFRTYVLPFEVISVLLLAALIGAVVLARKDEPERGGSERPPAPVARPGREPVAAPASGRTEAGS